MRTLAVIPARGGSKGVPGKNLHLLGGRPLVAHAVGVASSCRALAGFVVSTDDERIAGAGRSAGAAVLDRPSHLAADDTPMAPVLQHAVAWYEAQEGPLDAVVVLQPTAPLRTADDVAQALALLERRPDAESVVSVCSLEDLHPGRMYTKGPGGNLDPLWPEWERSNRQDLPPVWFRNGAIYAVRREALMERGHVIGSPALGYPMPARFWLNIDDVRDLAIAEALYRDWVALGTPLSPEEP